MPRPPLLLALATVLGACGDSTATTATTTTTGITGASQPTSDPSTGGEATPTTGGADSATGTSTGDGGGGGPKLDLGLPDFGGRDTDGAAGCVAVDLLFVIDNSPSMGPYQEALSAAFPLFVDEMFATLPPGTDLHVGITTTSFYAGNCSESTNNCESTASEATILEHYTPPTAGDNGENGGQGRLFRWDGVGFFAADTAGDPGPLKTWFTGAATAAGEVGCSFEMAAAGAGWSADPANAASNAGFIRDEGAVLALFFLQDEADQTPWTISGQPGGLAMLDKLAAAKTGCGGAECIIGGGFVNTGCLDEVPLGDLLDGIGAGANVQELPDEDLAEDSPALAAEEMNQLLRDTLASVIAQKCDEIMPPL